MENVPEDVTRRFAEVSDRLRRGGVPSVAPNIPDPALLAIIASRLEQIEEASRAAGAVFTRSGTTTGEPNIAGSGTTGVIYAAADTFRLPFVARSLSIMLPDTFGAYIQIASGGGGNPEWDPEIRLQGPIAVSLPLTVEWVRVRALAPGTLLHPATTDPPVAAAYANQAAYTIIATDTREPIGIALIEDTGLAAETAVVESAETVLLARLIDRVESTNRYLQAQAAATDRMVLALALLVDDDLTEADALSLVANG